MIRYAAFIENGECVGFCPLEEWPRIRDIDPDIERIVEFEGPPDQRRSYFEELKQLADAAVARELQRVPS